MGIFFAGGIELRDRHRGSAACCDTEKRAIIHRVEQNSSLFVPRAAAPCTPPQWF